MNHIYIEDGRFWKEEHVQELQVHDRAVRVWFEGTEPKQIHKLES